MTLAVAVAKFSGSDISQFLLDWAEVEDNPVRRTVLNVMADKRFLDTAKPVMMWREDASNELEAFADRLESERAAGRLTEERMNKLIEEFFSLWLALMGRRRRIYESSRKARKKARMDLEGNLPTKVNIPEGDGGNDEGRKEGMGPDMSGLQDFLEVNDDEEDDDFTGIGAGDPKLEQQGRENIYLCSIPESLKKLALLIGRAGEDVTETKGRFSMASKSDIEGITVGNNLSALLPSELVLLSEKATQDVFFMNFAEKRLQVFCFSIPGIAS